MIQFSLRELKRKIKNFLHLPVTRYELLQYAKELQAAHAYRGLCHLLDDALMGYDIHPLHLDELLPKYNIEYARCFGAHYHLYHGYWWERGRWDIGRLDFLNWLINEYKDDKTNIRKL